MSWSDFLDPLGIFKVEKPAEMQPDSFQKPPTSDEGGFIPILWGTRKIKTQNYTYFGDVKQVAIKSKSGKK